MSRPQEFDTDAVIDAAMRVLWDRGPHRTSVDDLLEASGIARSSLYNAFGGKEALFERAIERYIDQQVAQLDDDLGSRTLAAGLTLLFNRIVNDNFDGRGCLLVNCTGDVSDDGHVERRLLNAGFQRVLTTLERHVRGAQQRGEVGERTDPADLASLLCASLSGLRILHKAGLSKARLRRCAALAVKRLLDPTAA